MKSIVLILLLSVSACKVNHSSVGSPQPVDAIVQGKLFAAFYQQRAAEYKALCKQAYNAARSSLDLYEAKSTRPKAIVTDIDETVLDNSPYAVNQALKGKDYETTTWFEWTSKAVADTVPGAAAFLKYAATKGIEIFYVTNREESERKSTLENLKKFGLPNADDAHFFPRATVSTKEPRRQKILETHEIIMLVGDNLADLSTLFDKKSEAERTNQVNNFANEFGNRFILIPNTVYGDWEGALFNYNYKLTGAQKDSIVRMAVKGY